MDLVKRQPIGIELVQRNIITEEDLEKAVEYQKEHPERKIGEILYILKLCDENRLIEVLGEILGYKGILLKAEDVHINVTEYISVEKAKENMALPYEVQNGRVKVCFSDTVSKKNIEIVRLLMLNKGLILEPYITFGSIIENFLNTISGTLKESDIVIKGQEGTITNLVSNIIENAITKRASDIHIEPLKDSVRIRYRIDGELYVAANIEKEKQAQLIGRIKAISNMHQEKQDSQDGRITDYPGYNIRVSSQKNIYGEKFVLRLLKKNSNIRNIFELGFPGDESAFNNSINKRNSMTIIAAPTGEGKTTTLYSIIDYLNTPQINITTIENPVELRIDGLNQIEIDDRITFSDSLRTVLRQDPDIILVGEIRDFQTAEIAIQAGQTGHYVLSTIHTTDAIEVITRLRKLGVSDYDTASTLATTISERLLRRMCPKCKKARPFTDKEREIIQNIGNKYNVNFDTNVETYDKVGCEYCNYTGYYERIGIFEVLDNDEDIKELIMRGASSIEIRRKALEKSYKPLVVDGINKVLQGYTNLEELNRKVKIF